MISRRLILPLVAAVGLLLALPAPAKAAPSAKASSSREAAGGGKSKKKAIKKGGRVVCKGKGKARKCRRARGRFDGHGVSLAQLRTESLPRPSGRIQVYNRNLQEEVTVEIYNEDGSLNDGALAQLDRLFRCRRTQEERAVDPRLYEILSIIYDHYGQRVELTSGFRFQRNEGSRHFHASAMDISVPGVNYKELYDFAETLDLGGMGIGKYPNDGFVHIDFRAPGEPSYRWTDTSGPGSKAAGKLPSRMWRRSKPNS